MKGGWLRKRILSERQAGRIVISSLLEGKGAVSRFCTSPDQAAVTNLLKAIFTTTCSNEKYCSHC